MQFTPAPTFRQNPFAATRTYLMGDSLRVAVEHAVVLSLMPYAVYYWINDHELGLAIISNVFLLFANMVMISHIRAQRPPNSASLPTIGSFISMFLIWLALFKAFA